MSWCDRLASVPTVGFGLSPHSGLLEVFDHLSPIFDELFDQSRNPTFTTEQQQNGFVITTRDGFGYFIDHSRISVGFNHRMKAVAVSGGSPRMEMLSKPMPFTSLMPEVSRRLIEATRLLPRINERKIFQVGVVSVTRVAPEDQPPGIQSFVEYFGRPWSGAINSFNYEVTSDFDETDAWTDRCQHKITRPEDPEELTTLHFDFQRRFKTGQTASEAQLKTLVEKTSQAALSYFEALAEGDMFDGDDSNHAAA